MNNFFFSAFIAIPACFFIWKTDNNGPVDKHASKETTNLYRNLKRTATKGFLVGHQDDLAYGVHWKYQPDSSDVKSISGDYPALYGWDFSGIESGHDKNIDGVPFDSIKRYVQLTYQRGGVNTFSWHVPSPLGNGRTAWDTTHGTVASILPGGTNYKVYISWLDKLAAFAGSLKGNKGELIPILFRPFHECTGTWFWWCKNACSDSEFKMLWKFTMNYLQNEKKLHNLIFVYNTSGGFGTKENFLSRYPGSSFADVLTFDTYQQADPAASSTFEIETNKELSILEEIAKDQHKIFGLAETGYEQVPYATWWTDKLMKAIGDHQISYVLLWRNHGWNASFNPPRMHYYIPVRGDVSEADFHAFYELDRSLFESEARNEQLYR